MLICALVVPNKAGISSMVCGFEPTERSALLPSSMSQSRELLEKVAHTLENLTAK